MERAPREAFGAPEVDITRAERAFYDALVLASYELRAGAGAPPRAHALLGNVRTTATELAHRLARGGHDAAAVREALRAVVWDALRTSGCDVAALRPISETLGPLLDAD